MTDEDMERAKVQALKPEKVEESLAQSMSCAYISTHDPLTAYVEKAWAEYEAEALSKAKVVIDNSLRRVASELIQRRVRAGFSVLLDAEMERGKAVYSELIASSLAKVEAAAMTIATDIVHENLRASLDARGIAYNPQTLRGRLDIEVAKAKL